MAKSFNITSEKGFKYTDEENLVENKKTKITMICKHIPDQQSKFHHLELKLKKYQKTYKQEWDDIDEPKCSITLITKEKNDVLHKFFLKY